MLWGEEWQRGGGVRRGELGLKQINNCQSMCSKHLPAKLLYKERKVSMSSFLQT